MLFKLWQALIFTCWIEGLVAQQQDYPQHYFSSPIDSPIYLSGNFCTLRNDHFHYGIDITTFEKEGLPVLAVADGFVSRIKVSPVGYGKVIYIDHPNGFTSVYGHLSAFAPAFAQAVRDSQYFHETFETEFFPKPGSWPVQKGAIIAWSGNSGGSSGPHIHFEIRDTKTEEIINPLLFGFRILDTIPPEIPQVAFQRNLNSMDPPLLVPDSITASDTFNLPAGNYTTAAIINDFGIHKHIRFAPQKIALLKNDTIIFAANFERFSFDQAKQINQYILYNYYYQHGIRFQQLRTPNHASLKFFTQGPGQVQIQDGNIIKLSIVATDAALQTGEREFFVRGIPNTDSEATAIKILAFESVIFPNAAYHFEETGLQLHGNIQAVFDTMLLGRTWFGCDSCGKIKIYTNQGYQPFYKGLTLKLKIPQHLLGQKSKAIFYWSDGISKPIPLGGKVVEDFLECIIYKPGIFEINLDQTPPKIVATNLNKKLQLKGRVPVFKIWDSESGIKDYRAWLDGKWVLTEWDPKTNRLLFPESDIFTSGKHQLKLQITDHKNNQNTWVHWIKIR